MSVTAQNVQHIANRSINKGFSSTYGRVNSTHLGTLKKRFFVLLRINNNTLVGSLCWVEKNSAPQSSDFTVMVSGNYVGLTLNAKSFTVNQSLVESEIDDLLMYANSIVGSTPVRYRSSKFPKINCVTNGKRKTSLGKVTANLAKYLNILVTQDFTNFVLHNWKNGVTFKG